MTAYPCDNCKNKRCIGAGCRRWEMWFREHWAYIHAMAVAYNIQPTTPPTEEVIEIDEEPAESDS